MKCWHRAVFSTHQFLVIIEAEKGILWLRWYFPSGAEAFLISVWHLIPILPNSVSSNCGNCLISNYGSWCKLVLISLSNKNSTLRCCLSQSYKVCIRVCVISLFNVAHMRKSGFESNKVLQTVVWLVTDRISGCTLSLSDCVSGAYF